MSDTIIMRKLHHIEMLLEQLFELTVYRPAEGEPDVVIPGLDTPIFLGAVPRVTRWEWLDGNEVRCDIRVSEEDRPDFIPRLEKLLKLQSPAAARAEVGG